MGMTDFDSEEEDFRFMQRAVEPCTNCKRQSNFFT